MITLYIFGPKFDLPDPSPFCMKALVLLKMAGLEFNTDTANLSKAPKGKAPYMDDDGTIVAIIGWSSGSARRMIARASSKSGAARP